MDDNTIQDQDDEEPKLKLARQARLRKILRITLVIAIVVVALAGVAGVQATRGPLYQVQTGCSAAEFGFNIPLPPLAPGSLGYRMEAPLKVESLEALNSLMSRCNMTWVSQRCQGDDCLPAITKPWQQTGFPWAVIEGQAQVAELPYAIWVQIRVDMGQILKEAVWLGDEAAEGYQPGVFDPIAGTRLLAITSLGHGGETGWHYLEDYQLYVFPFAPKTP